MNARWLLIVLLVALVPGPVLAAQAKPNKAKLHQQDQDIAKARDKLGQAKKEADAAKSQLARAQADLVKMREKAAAIRKKIEEEHDSKPDLSAARKEAEQCRQAYEQLSGPILTAVRQGEGYKAAVAAFEAARKRFTGSAQESPAERDRLAAAYKAAQAAPRNMETAAIEADPQAKAAKEAQTRTGEALRALLEKRDAAIAKDPRLADLLADIKKSETELAQAQQKMAAEARQRAEAERKLRAEEQQKREMAKKAQQPARRPQPRKRR